VSADLSQYSPHLFWDVDRHKLDLQRHKPLIVQRVLEYGLLDDWHLLVRQLGVAGIAEVAADQRTLDLRALSFVALRSKTPRERFRCYTTRQSIPSHWNF
jgi:hypothetical protein